MASCADEIYVFKQRDGSIRFTNRRPPPGIEAKVFTPRSAGFSVYKISGAGYGRGKLFSSTYNELIKFAARQHGVDPHLLKAVIHVESAFNASAVSPKGAQGLMQLMPSTARRFGVKNAFRPQDNISGGTRLLKQLIAKYNGNLKLALAAYNAGEEAVSRYNGIPPYSETQNYVRKVLHFKERYRGTVKG